MRSPPSTRYTSALAAVSAVITVRYCGESAATTIVHTEAATAAIGPLGPVTTCRVAVNSANSTAQPRAV